METLGETCKLCLKYIQSDALVSLDDKILEKLSFLQMNLDKSVEDSNFLCEECGEAIENAFNFKSRLVNSTEFIGSEDSRHNIPSTSTDETSSEKVICHLCKLSVDRLSVITLMKLLKDDSMMEVFQRHIQEVDVKNIEEIWKVCGVCQKSLASFSALVASWFIANEWNEEDMGSCEIAEVKTENIEGDGLTVNVIPSTSAINQSKSQKEQLFTDDAGCSSTQIKTEFDETLNIKEENDENQDVKMSKLQLRNEVDNPDRFGFRKRRKQNQVDLTKKSRQAPKKSRKRHSKKNKEILDLDRFNCVYCSYVTTYGKVFLRHILKHKDEPLDVETFQCKLCPYVTTNEDVLKQHAPTHKFRTGRLQVLKCAHCIYASNRKSSLQSHLLKHKDIGEVDLYKCDHCSFVTKWKSSSRQHALTHKPIDEVKKFSCYLCTYITIYKSHLKKHLSSVHNTPKPKNRSDNEGDMYRCASCPYSTKLIGSLRKHRTIHELPNLVKEFKCDQCPFTTNWKSSIIDHALVHKNFDEINPFRCHLCPFVTKRKRELHKHVLVHTKKEEKIFYCDKCSYITRYKACLDTHVAKHLE